MKYRNLCRHLHAYAKHCTHSTNMGNLQMQILDMVQMHSHLKYKNLYAKHTHDAVAWEQEQFFDSAI